MSIQQFKNVAKMLNSDCALLDTVGMYSTGEKKLASDMDEKLAPTGTRTQNLLLRRQAQYPLCHRGIWST
jgi:hypothetical protein